MPTSGRYRQETSAKKFKGNLAKSSVLYSNNKKTPSPLNIFKGDALGWEMIQGEIAAMNDKIQEEHKFRWKIEAMVCLSQDLRCRVLRIVALPPLQNLLSPGGFKDSRRHLLEKQARNKLKRNAVLRETFYLEEDIEELKEWSPHIPDRKISEIEERNISVDGCIRMIKDICDSKWSDVSIYQERGVPGPSALIQISLDGAHGILCSRADLEQNEPHDLVASFLHDLVTCTKGDKRSLYFDPRTEGYVRKERHQVKIERNKVAKVFKNLESRIQKG